MNSKKKEPWRIIIGIFSVAFIALMWVKKDILTMYTTMPKEQFFSLVATTVAVTLIKIIGIAGLIFLVKWIVSKIRNRK